MLTKTNLKSLELNNRIVMAPMCTYSADETGLANDWHFVHYVTRAVGQVGLIIVEATGVEPRGRITNRDLGIWSDEHIPGLKRIVDGVHQYGSKIAIQLGHAGRKAKFEQVVPIAPSAISFNEHYDTPHEMSETDIKSVIEAFKNAARRAYLAGFDAIEIHAAHGYLLNQFISPLTNKRTDHYGGTLENRVRLLKEVIAAVKMEWPEHLPILVRLSANEYHSDGHGLEETMAVVNIIKDEVDLIDVSSGGVVEAPIKAFPGYQIPLAEAIKYQCNVKTIAGGLITDYQMVEEILNNNRADYVFLGRELLRNPYFVIRYPGAKEKEIIPYQYKRGF